MSSLIQLSFGTCAAPLFFEVFTAICYASTYKLDLLWNVRDPTVSYSSYIYI